jgi:hypothetical protein
MIMTQTNIRDQLLAALSVKTESVAIEGFGSVSIRQITAGEAETLRSFKVGSEEDARKEFAYRLLARSLFDTEGNSIFSDDDIALLRQSSDAGLQQLIVAVLKLNGYLKDDARGNSDSGPSVASVSA